MTLTKRIKVVQLLEWFEAGGGLERIVGEIADGLDKTTYDVEIWCVAHGGTLIQVYRDKGFTVRELNISTYFNPLNVLKLAALFKEVKPDIVHAHVYFAATIGRVAGWLAGVPVMIHHVHSMYWHYSSRNVWMERILSRCTSKIICVSAAVRNFVTDFEKIDISKTVVIPNGITASVPSIDRTALRKALNIEEQDAVIISVANFFENKGHAVLLEAVGQLKGRYPNLKVLVVGSGEKEAELKEQAGRLNLKDRVQFLGVRHDIPELLNASDIFVLASLKREGMPVAILEAMACGVPVVATEVGGIPEVVVHERNGLLARPKDAASLAECLERLLENPGLRRSLGGKGQKDYEDQFTAEHMVSDIEYVYERELRMPEAYESEDIVAGYEKETELQKPEQTILEVLSDRLPGFDMLDIGVGGGRTTVHFAPLVKSYVGVDYSEGMIDACQRRFKHSLHYLKFHVGDARAMTEFPDASFDFILFSYNGIDCVSYEDRPLILKEIKRLLKPGGYFCFSTHNTLSLGRFLTYELCKNPRWLWNLICRRRNVRKLIRRHQGVGNIPYALVRDGGENFRTEVIYIKPKLQMDQLREFGFVDIRMFSESGSEIRNALTWNESSGDRWVYFLCATP